MAEDEMIGPGKYDDLCTLVREGAGITGKTIGGVCIVVLNGNKGSGFSVQADLQTASLMAEVLAEVVKQMRAEVAQ